MLVLMLIPEVAHRKTQGLPLLVLPVACFDPPQPNIARCKLDVCAACTMADSAWSDDMADVADVCIIGEGETRAVHRVESLSHCQVADWPA